MARRAAGTGSVEAASVHFGTFDPGRASTSPLAPTGEHDDSPSVNVGRVLDGPVVAEEQAWLEVVQRMTRAVDLRDADTGRHVDRVATYATIIACELGLDTPACQAIRAAAPLHDAGKIGIPDRILHKEGPLTDEEHAVMATHTTLGHELLADSGSPLLDLAASIALTHHERWDGTGYPNGLAGDDIPLEGRITAVADVFDALTHDRVYGAALPVPDVLEHLRRDRGTAFDPAVVDAFLRRLPEVLAVRSTARRTARPRQRSLR